MTKYHFKIKMIRVDGEGAINTEWFHNKVGLRGIILDVTGAGEAVAVVERKIRHINDVIDYSTKPRTAGAITLMSSGNLEGSWYYMLLSNEQIVKRTKSNRTIHA